MYCYIKFSNISITNFFKRRIYRIYPFLITVTIITLIVFIKFPLISIKNRVFYEAVSTSIGLENFYQILHNLSYWEQGVKSPLLHTWSICIELQFYILWPFIIKFILKKFKNNKLKLRKILVFISCLILISFYQIMLKIYLHIL